MERLDTLELGGSFDGLRLLDFGRSVALTVSAPGEDGGVSSEMFELDAVGVALIANWLLAWQHKRTE